MKRRHAGEPDLELLPIFTTPADGRPTARKGASKTSFIERQASRLVFVVAIAMFVLCAYLVQSNMGLQQALTDTRTRLDDLEIASFGRSKANKRRTALTEPLPDYHPLQRKPKKNGKPLNLEERMTHLEHKVNGHIGWNKDPNHWMEIDHKCQNATNLPHKCRKELYPKDGELVSYWWNKTETCTTDQWVCLDKWNPDKPCIVYDIGIRANPQFGFVMHDQFGCEVHAFDPSDISKMWKEYDQKDLDKMPNYHFHDYGAGGRDGVLPLFHYNWNQISNMFHGVKFNEETHQNDIKTLDTLEIPVKTLGTMMRELGHDYLTILKIDVEGSEYGFLEQILDEEPELLDRIGQITMEWHHFDIDQRYGSPNDVNSLIMMLNNHGHKVFTHGNTAMYWWNYFEPAKHEKPIISYKNQALCRSCWMGDEN